eukprot:scaffold22832_cov71-Phaeocystis_antarctica.AAC.4
MGSSAGRVPAFSCGLFFCVAPYTLLHYIAALHSCITTSDDSGQKGPGSSLLAPAAGKQDTTDINYSDAKSSVTVSKLAGRRDALTVGGDADARGGGVLVLLCLAARALPPARTTSSRPCACPTGRGRG